MRGGEGRRGGDYLYTVMQYCYTILYHVIRSVQSTLSSLVSHASGFVMCCSYLLHGVNCCSVVYCVGMMLGLPYHTIPYHTIPYHTTTIPYHTIPYHHHTVPHHTVPYNTGDLELLELLEPHVTPATHPLALYELLGACARSSGGSGSGSDSGSNICTDLSQLTAAVFAEKRAEDAAKAKAKKTRRRERGIGGWGGPDLIRDRGRNHVAPLQALASTQGQGQGQGAVRERGAGQWESMLSLVTRLLERQSQSQGGREEGGGGEEGWADATAAALSVPPLQPSSSFPSPSSYGAEMEPPTALHLAVSLGLPVALMQVGAHDYYQAALLYSARVYIAYVHWDSYLSMLFSFPFSSFLSPLLNFCSHYCCCHLP